ncbi:MAG: DUF975 family protein [Bacteroidales bacterium]|nr:DUF975 family protein [Bacteroidales bacterium]MCM1416072.1 DUF975 family protein [bacterium]MCM1422791.1 DUF975 family protein [bacterium]
MNQFKSSAELKAIAREHLLGHYGTVIGAEVILMGISGSVGMLLGSLLDISTVVGTIIYYAIMFFLSVLMGLFTSGTCYLYLKLLCRRPVNVGDLFYGFQLSPDKAIAMQAWISLISYAATLPQIVITYKISAAGPHIEKLLPLLLPYSLALILSGVVSVILGLVYAQPFYLLHDFPQYTAKELLKKSRRLMVHHKGRLFYLYVSFLPLMLLGLFSFGLALLWVVPYMTATQTAFFLDLIQHNTEAA